MNRINVIASIWPLTVGSMPYFTVNFKMDVSIDDFSLIGAKSARLHVLCKYAFKPMHIKCRKTVKEVRIKMKPEFWIHAYKLMWNRFIRTLKRLTLWPWTQRIDPDFREHFTKLRILKRTYCDINWVLFLPLDPKLISVLTIFDDMIFCRAPFLKISVKPRQYWWHHDLND